MHKSIKYYLTFLILVIVTATFGQKKTYSPFSRYGIGELNTTGYGQNAAMGNSGIGLKSNDHLNILNPASYSSIDSMSFFFEAGITGYSQMFKSDEGEETYKNIDFNYFAMGFPISRRIHSSWGLRPFSNSGYNFEFSDDTNLNKAIGTGNLTSAYGGLSFKATPHLSLGVHGTYLFGNIRHTSFIEFLDDSDAYKYGIQSELYASDFFFDFGAQYTHQIAEDKNVTVGLTYRPLAAISGNFQKTVAKGSQYAEDGKLFETNIVIPEASDSSDISSFDLAREVGFGLSYSHNNHLLLAADYSLGSWGEITFPDGNTKTTNNYHASAGAEYIPNIRSRNYLNRIRYRAGIKYNEEYIKINNQNINNFGITFGVGLPYSRSKTSINLAVELGKKEPAGNFDMIENYGKVTINFTFHEFWFIKRKFD